MTLRHIIWDMGGTLIDTYPSVANSLSQAIRSSATADPDEQRLTQRMRASSIAETIASLAAEYDISPTVLEDAYRALKASWEHGATPPVMPAAAGLIRRVQAAGGKNIVVTHRDRESASALLAGTGLAIDGMITVSDGFARKPNPAMFHAALTRFDLDTAQTLAIGDRMIDIAAAEAAGCTAVLLTHPGDLALDAAAGDSDRRVNRIGSLTEAAPLIPLDTPHAKMIAGEPYYADVPTLAAARVRARALSQQFNSSAPDALTERAELLTQLLGRSGGVDLQPPFHCDYGTNIRFGDACFVNFDGIFLDVAPIIIGDRVQFGPGVQLLTPTHPLDAAERATGIESAAPITIGDDVWLGGNVMVLGGVTIGARTIVGAGSVVTRSLPENVIAAGNPARILREVPTATER
ncbi:HAD-IA family hydrolase [Gulosibacter hominis]|uniref:HAD-IA family hydrolase n=1 Tax=Gulosibacter hominis TaxID=2770504 RepID=UPI00191A1966|nr:HAD-IA family hydrolase [Gulosibacter hominis]